MFSLCGQSNELDFINQTIDFVGFPFKVYRSTGVFCRSGFSTKPLAAQTLDAQADNMRLCTPLRCKKCPCELVVWASKGLVFLKLGNKICKSLLCFHLILMQRNCVKYFFICSPFLEQSLCIKSAGNH